MKTIIRLSAGFCIFLLILSCESNSIVPALPDDYFQLSEGTELTYYKEGISTADHADIWFQDTVKFTVSHDTLIDNISYKMIINEYGFLDKVVRQMGTQYFGRHHELYGSFSKEYLFLDTSLPVNASWEHVKDEGHTKTEYVVKNIHSTYTLNDVQYKNVIELEVNYYTDYADGINLDLHYSVSHFYAAGIGEIYAYYPSPASGMYSDVRYSLLSSQIK
jgi:hypothetical protein